MKNSLKTLRIALVSTAILATFSASARAETFTFSGNVAAATCTLGIYTAAAGTVASLAFTVPDISLAGNPTFTNGGAGATAGATTFFIKVPATCATGGTTGKFNVGLSAANLTGNRAANTGTATNVLFDFSSQATAVTQAGSVVLTVTAPTSSAAATTQTGWGDVLTTGNQSFNVRYYKTTATATAPTAGTVVATITATAFYP